MPRRIGREEDVLAMTRAENKLLCFVCGFDRYESERAFLCALQAFLIDEMGTDP